MNIEEDEAFKNVFPIFRGALMPVFFFLLIIMYYKKIILLDTVYVTIWLKRIWLVKIPCEL